MSGTTEAVARVRIDALLEDAGWNSTDGSSVLFEHALPANGVRFSGRDHVSSYSSVYGTFAAVQRIAATGRESIT